jgi:hypothetical protein
MGTMNRQKFDKSWKGNLFYKLPNCHKLYVVCILTFYFYILNIFY